MIPGPQQTPENLLLADVVVHSAIVFNGMGLDILKPFNAIVNSPAELKVISNSYSRHGCECIIRFITRAREGRRVVDPKAEVVINQIMHMTEPILHNLITRNLITTVH